MVIAQNDLSANTNREFLNNSIHFKAVTITDPAAGLE